MPCRWRWRTKGWTTRFCSMLHLEARERDLSAWFELLDRIRKPQGEVRIAVVGKYVQLEDAYKSLREALIHGGLAHKDRTIIEWVEAEELDSRETAALRLRHADGILIPGGFGKRGIQGMIYAIEYARTHKVPFFGICLGMQCATIEYARDVVGLAGADSTEFDPQTPHRVIYKLRELLGVDEMGGTMRLGAWPCKIEKDSTAFRAYGTTEISERHRHRYEFNCEYEKTLTDAGFRITGRSPDGKYVEIIEAPEPSLVSRLPVPSGIQVEAARAASALLTRSWARRTRINIEPAASLLEVQRAISMSAKPSPSD